MGDSRLGCGTKARDGQPAIGGDAADALLRRCRRRPSVRTLRAVRPRQRPDVPQAPASVEKTRRGSARSLPVSLTGEIPCWSFGKRT